MRKGAALTEGNIGKTLLGMTIPMVIGIIGMVISNLVDTFFIGQLGSKELAAMSFTFPAVLSIASISFGLGTGASAIISKAIGKCDSDGVRRLTTDALILATLIAICIMCMGIINTDKIFSALGANDDLIPLIKKYMKIWFLSVPFVVIPMVGNCAIRATGDTKTPSMIMLFAITVNIILDPLLIFGIEPFPRMGLAGAAIASFIARSVAFTIAIWVLCWREKMIMLNFPGISTIFGSWRQILYIGIPTATTNLIVPLSLGIITRLVSKYGNNAIAAFGVGGQVQMLVMSVVMALSSVLVPFVGQNMGADKPDRVKKGIKISHIFSIYWGLFVFVTFFLISEKIAYVFNDDDEVVKITSLFLIITSAGYGFNGILRLSCASLNALNKPLISAALMFTNMFILLVPLAYCGSQFFGLTGIVFAPTLSNFFSGIVSLLLVRIILSGNYKGSGTKFIKYFAI